jgi:microcystin-dependent protein
VLTSNGAGALPTMQTITSFVSGMIILWSGSSGSIPSGWLLCDGTSSTPNLRDRFVVGAGTTYAVGATGGSADLVVPSHTHTITDPTHNHTFSFTYGSTAVGGGGSANTGAGNTTTTSSATGISVNTAGVSPTNANLPPYYALCYIMKS